jgi:molybdopterin-guanine dinucleotide biosynthesis protein A
VVPRAVEVGPGFSGLPSVREDPPGRGPLPAIWAGAAALGGGAALVVACDLPLVTAEVLAVLARWPGKCSVVPVVGDQPQVLCARWAAADLAAVPSLVAAGERGVRALLGRPGVELVTEAAWPGRLDPRALADVDSPADLDALGLEWSAPDGRDGDS